MQVGDLAGGLGHPGAQRSRVQNLDLGPQREQVEHRGLGGLDRDPGFGPAVPARSGRDTTTDPQAGRPALQDGKPPAPGDSRIRAHRAPATGRWCSPRRLPASSLVNPSMSSNPPRRPRIA